MFVFGTLGATPSRHKATALKIRIALWIFRMSVCVCVYVYVPNNLVYCLN